MMKRQRWFWGVFFLLCGLLLIASKVGWLGGSLGFWSIIFTVFFIAGLVEGLVHFNIPVIVFSVAFLLIVYAKQLGITQLVPWTILGAAVFISVGLSLLFHARFIHLNHLRLATPSSGKASSAQVKIDAKMVSTIRYVRSENFKEAAITASMASLKVYFDDTLIKGDSAVINIHGSLSGIELYVPKTWDIIVQVEPVLSGIEEKGGGVTVAETARPRVYLKGDLNLSGLEINYIF